MVGLKSVGGIGFALLTICVLSPRLCAAELNDYPTSARVDYVFACMKANGETQVSLQKCS